MPFWAAIEALKGSTWALLTQSGAQVCPALPRRRRGLGFVSVRPAGGQVTTGVERAHGTTFHF